MILFIVFSGSGGESLRFSLFCSLEGLKLKRILRRLLYLSCEMNRSVDGTSAPDALRFRLVFVQREGSELVEQVVYQSGLPE